MLAAPGYAFSLYSIPTFVTMSAVLLLGVLALARERISAVSASFFLVTLVVGVWLFAQSWLYLATDERVALWWSRAAYLGVPFIAAATYQFTVIVLGIYRRYKVVVWAAWGMAGLFSLAAIGTGALISDLYHYPWGYYAHYSWLGLPFVTYFGALLGASMVHYWREYRTSPRGVHRDRIGALMLAFAIGYLGSVDFVPAYGVPLYPFGYLAILGFVVAAARAIWTYRLVDITPAFAAKQIINTMTDALFVLDQEGVIRVANRAAGKLFGSPTAELTGKAAVEVIGDPLFSDPGQFSALVQAGGVMNHEIDYRRGDGEVRCLSLSASVARDKHEHPVATVCIGRDITERKRAEERMQQQNAYLGALHDTSLALMNRLDLADLLEVILQHAGALVGTPHGYIYVVEPEKGRLVLQAGVGLFSQSVGEGLKKGEGLAGKVWETAQPMVVSDYSTWPERAAGFKGVPFHAVVGFPLASASQVVGVLGLAHLEAEQTFTPDGMDILTRFAQLASIALDNARLYGAAQKELAERRRAESEIKMLNEDLERRVLQRTEQLEFANKELEAFSYSVSHDLRAPLRAVTGFSNAVLEDYGEQFDAEGQRYLALIRDSATNMGQLVDDLLSFSRLGRQQMELQEVNMGQLAHSVFEEIELINPGRNLRLDVKPLP
ncbi:MAG: GAF domain-containing protein, partial [Chloroflexia bacterium]